MQEYREYLKYNLKYAGIWNIMEYNAHIPNIVDDFASDGPLVGDPSPGSSTDECNFSNDSS